MPCLTDSLPRCIGDGMFFTFINYQLSIINWLLLFTPVRDDVELIAVVIYWQLVLQKRDSTPTIYPA
jgi:hypothetical protein